MAEDALIDEAQDALCKHTDACTEKLARDTAYREQFIKNSERFGQSDGFEEPPYR